MAGEFFAGLSSRARPGRTALSNLLLSAHGHQGGISFDKCEWNMFFYEFCNLPIARFSFLVPRFKPPKLNGGFIMTKKFKGKTYLDPKYDPAFKELFDSEDAIKDFLNDVLQLADGDKIKSLTFSFDKVLRFRTPKSKKVILDVFITTASGRFLNIEMQKWKQNKYIMISLPNFKKSKEEVCSRLDAWLG